MAHFKPPLDTATLKAGHDLRDLVESLWGPPQRRSQDYVVYHAPDRQERTASLTIWRDGFKDFGDTRPGGDHFTFLERYEGMNFKKALHFLGAETAPHNGKATQPRHKARRSVDAQFATPRPGWEPRARQVLRKCQKDLCNSPQVVQFLIELGYTQNSITARGLGYNARWRKLGWQDAAGKDAWLPPGIVYPWIVDGTLRALKVRCPHTDAEGQPDALATLMGHDPLDVKYMQARGGSIRTAWYGDRTAPDCPDPERPVILTEGEKDRDNLARALGQHVDVITLGSAAAPIPAPLLPRLEKAAWIVVMYDNDHAGDRNARRVMQTLRTEFPRKVVLERRVPLGSNDISDWLVQRSPFISADEWLQETIATVDSVRITSYLPREQVFVWPQGVPDTLREAILGMHQLVPQGKRYVKDQSNALAVLELIHTVVRNGAETQPLTVAQLKDAQQGTIYQFSDSSLRRGLDQLVALGFLSECPPEKCSKFTGEGVKSDKNAVPQPKRTGRPRREWYPVPLAQALPTLRGVMARRVREALYADTIPDVAVAEWFAERVDATTAEDAAAAFNTIMEDLRTRARKEIYALERTIETSVSEWQVTLDFHTLACATSTPLLDDLRVNCGRDMRDLFYASMVATYGPRGRQIARAEAARQIGVDPKTLSAVRKRTGITTDANFATFQIPKIPTDVCFYANLRARWAANREFGRYLESSSGERIRLDRHQPEAMTAWVKRHMMLGYKVFLRVQVASTERFATAEELAQREADDAYRADQQAAAAAAHHISETSVHKATSTGSQTLTNGQPAPSPAPQAYSADRPSRGFVHDQLVQCLQWLYDRREEVPGEEDALCDVLVAYGLRR